MSQKRTRFDVSQQSDVSRDVTKCMAKNRLKLFGGYAISQVGENGCGAFSKDCVPRLTEAVAHYFQGPENNTIVQNAIQLQLTVFVEWLVEGPMSIGLIDDYVKL